MIPTSIDGTDITGATIDGTDVTEITVDGQTVFTATPSIPSSAIHHWPHRTGSGSTLFDDVGSLDGTISGASWVSGTFVDGQALDYNGDRVTFSTIPEIRETTSWSVAVTIEVDDNQQGVIWRHSTGGSGDEFFMALRDFEIAVARFDGGYTDRASTTGNFVSTGTKYRIFWIYDAGTTELYVNNIKRTGTQIPFGAFGTAGHLMGERADNARPLDGRTDDLIIMDKAESAATVSDDFDRQPWSP